MAQCVEFDTYRLRYGGIVKFFRVVPIRYDVLVVDFVFYTDVPQFLLSVADFFFLLVC